MITNMFVDEINRSRDLSSFLSESYLRKHLKYVNTSELNWMRIFNSDMILSNDFIIDYMRYINWNWFIRPLSEQMLNRLQIHIVQWNIQLCCMPRTYDFIIEHQSKFDWQTLSYNPPYWFTDVHYQCFGHLMNWKPLTKFIPTLSITTLIMFEETLDWDWISVNFIPSESFAKRFLMNINWDLPNLDISNLSTEFLYDLHQIRLMCHNMNDNTAFIYISEYTKIQAPICTHLGKNFDPNQPIRIGSTITLRFVLKHINELDMDLIKQRGLLTDDMIEAIAESQDVTIT